MDEKKEDKSDKSFHDHLIFYKKLNKKIKDIQDEKNFSNDNKVIQHLTKRIEALELDKTRIKKLFQNEDAEIWDKLDKK